MQKIHYRMLAIALWLLATVHPAVPVPSQILPMNDHTLHGVDEVWGMIYGAKWTGHRYVPFLVGDDPSEFKALPRGAGIMVGGDIGAMAGDYYPTLPNTWILEITSNSAIGRAVECRFDWKQLVYFQSHRKNAWRIVVHGVYREPGDLAVILQPCYIDGMFDLHGDLTRGDPKAVPESATEKVIESKLWPDPKSRATYIPPKILYRIEPEYSAEAREKAWQGTVPMRITVGTDGLPHDVMIQHQLGLGLDEKAIEAVKQWRFEPATKDGQPVAVEISVEISFRLY